MPIPHFVAARLLALCLVLPFAAVAVAQVPQPPEVAAKSYIVLDLTTNQTLAERNADAPADPAPRPDRRRHEDRLHRRSGLLPAGDGAARVPEPRPDRRPRQATHHDGRSQHD